MKQINISNKKLDDIPFNIIDVNHISSKCGKPFCGVWFSLPFKDNSFESEWHNYTEYNMLNPSIIKNLYLTNNNTTYVTTLTLKNDTKVLSVNEISSLLNEKATKQQIIKKLNLKNTNNLVLSINTKKDLQIITSHFPSWDDDARVNNSQFWNYVATNFVGCNFDENLFKEVKRMDSNLIYILEIPSFVAFSKNGFMLKTEEKKLNFSAVNNANNDLIL